MKVHLVALGAADAPAHIAFTVWATGEQGIYSGDDFLVLGRQRAVLLDNDFLVGHERLKDGMKLGIRVFCVMVSIEWVFHDFR